ncbi:hypothetical protein, partial [Blautia sp.]|uniref:hypothetical protein n=1 Tax=Blautia sp. TaxID=1955243 RepID=UPI0025BE889B
TAEQLFGVELRSEADCEYPLDINIKAGQVIEEIRSSCLAGFFQVDQTCIAGISLKMDLRW